MISLSWQTDLYIIQCLEPMIACLFGLLRPANEVWGKVIFLHMSVSHSVHIGGGGSTWAGTPWQVHPPGRYTPRQVHPPWQVHSSGQIHPPAGSPPAMQAGIRQQAGGTHPTGMHFCQIMFLIMDTVIINNPLDGSNVWFLVTGRS